MGPPTILPPLLSLPLPLFPSLSRRNLSVLPPLSFPLSSLFPKLGRSHFFSPYSTPVHPFSSPPFADLSFPPTDERSKRGTSVEFSRSDDFNLSSGRKRSGTRSKGVSLSLFFLYFLLLVILLLCFRPSCSCLEVRNQEGWYPSWRGGGARRGSAVNRRRGREFRQLVSTW